MNKALRRMTALVLMLLMLVNSAAVQAGSQLTGTWQGQIELPGLKLEISVTFDGKGQGTISIPMQQLKDYSLGQITANGDQISFALPGIPGDPRVTAKFVAADQIEGSFTQSGASFPCALRRASTAEEQTAAATQEETLKSIQASVKQIMGEWNVPGVGLGIIKDGKVILSQGFGYRDVEKKQPVDADTLFAIGSSTKAFTTMAVASAVDEGLLSWDKPVVEYVPWFHMKDPVASKAVTLRDMALHRTGLPRHDLAWYGSELSREDMVRAIAHLDSSVGFREAWQYNNFMYTSIGYVLEQATGVSWEENIQKKIFSPLGMTNSNFTVSEMVKAANAALPYEGSKDGATQLAYRSIDSIGPAGSINSSVNDMTRWVQALLAGGQVNGTRLVSQGRFAELITPQMTLPAGGFPETPFSTYAMGWMVDSYRGHTVVHHGGNIDGFSALVSFLPSDGIGIVVLTNANGSPAPTIIERRVLDGLLQLPTVDWSSRLKQQMAAIPDELPTAPPQISSTVPSRSLDQFVGNYSHPAYGQVQVVKAEDGLRVQYHHIDEPLSHWHYDVFVAKVKQGGLTTQIPVQFLSGMDGYVNKMQMVLEASVDPIVFTRVAGAEIPETVIDALLGKYVTMGTPITLSDNNGTLVMEIPGQPPYTLQADQGERFSVKELPDFYVHYELDEQGQVVSITLQQPGGSFVATPVK